MILAAALLVVLHTVGGRAVYINPAQVVSIGEAGAGVSRDTHCVLTFANSKFLAVIEECSIVRQRLEEVKEKMQ